MVCGHATMMELFGAPLSREQTNFATPTQSAAGSIDDIGTDGRTAL